jgi:molecular chaperone DnaK (HSP70)
LDPDILRAAQEADPAHTPSQSDVERWTEDYLHQLYSHVDTRLSGDLPSSKSWQTAKIDFVFSVPTTWSPEVVANFKRIALSAGWGACRAHSLKIGLTEAEAAAVYVASEARAMFEEGDVVLMCDAGGGTTDLSILRVTGAQRGVPSLEQMVVVKGQTIGSTQIDQAFEDLALDRLGQADATHALQNLKGEPLDHGAAAWHMAKSAQFQDAKCYFGSSDDVNFGVTIPNVSDTYDSHAHNIQGGKLLMELTELQELFDDQIQPLFSLIDSQLSSFADQYPDEEVAHLVLSGGLGNSAYVQKRLKDRYSGRTRTGLTRDITFHVSPEPQLAVCKGACLDHLGKIDSGRSVLSKRCCRASYGTECKVLYNPKNAAHQMMDVELDPNDGKKYIRHAVEWFIKK